MAMSEAIEALVDDARHWRRELHKIPELQYDVVQTAKFVADRLHAFGCDEVKMVVGRSGVVGIIKGRGGEGPAIALRADMDALPIEERTNLPYRSTIPARCTPAATTGIPRCCSARRGIWPRRAPFAARRSWCFSRPKKAARAPRRCWRTASSNASA